MNGLSRRRQRNAFRAAKNETALDHYQVRKWGAWYRHVTLAMCALAWLAVTGASQRPPPGSRDIAGGPGYGGPGREGGPARGRIPGPPPRGSNLPLTNGDRGHGLIPLTVNEIRKLHAIFRQPAHPLAHHEHWSHWRRRHQAAARHCHYQRRRL